MTQSKKKVIVVMPAYNAEHTLEKTYRDIPAKVVSKVILVDDVSEDDTVSVAKNLGIKVVVHTQNKGYGGNQKTCYLEALKEGADIVVMLHPDYQYDSTLIPEMIAPILSGRADFVMGSRIIGDGALKGGMPLWKYIANRALTTFENFILNKRFSDLHTGFRAYSRKMLCEIPFLLNSDDFIFDGQMIAQANYLGFPTTEIPIPTRYFEGMSSVGLWTSIRYGSQTLKVMMQLALQKSGLLSYAIFTKRLKDVLAVHYHDEVFRLKKNKKKKK